MDQRDLGRPGLTALLVRYLDLHGGDSGKTWRHLLVEALLRQAIDGNLRALQEIWLRLEGKAGILDSPSSPSLVIDDELARIILQHGRDASSPRGDDEGGDDEAEDHEDLGGKRQ
mgnify:FL=1